MTDITIEAFDHETADDAAFEARYELATLISKEEAPEDPMEPYDRWRAAWRHVPSWQKRHDWSAIDTASGQLVGVGSLPLEYLETNRHLAWFTVQVRPEARRRGIGSRLLAQVVTIAKADGRTILGTGAVEGSAGEAFLQAFGAELKSTERKSRLAIDRLDLDMMREWVKRAEERAAGYRLVEWNDRCPDDYLARFVELHDVTNTAPRDDLEMDDQVHTAERHRENEERNLAQGGSSWTMVAEEVSSGQLAGFTDLYFSADHDDIAWQGWTAVDPAHRNLGLGRWLKAAMALKLVEAKPAVRNVDTWNAFSNGPMLNINIAMGFELIRGYSDWQAPTERFAEHLGARTRR